jgi:proliferating cell nuclear antigen
MFEITVEDIKSWKKCVDAILNLVKEGSFEFDNEGIKLKAMDPSQIAMVLFSMNKNAFSKYEIDAKTKVGINIENFSKILSRARAGDKMVMRMDGGRFNVSFIGNNSRREFRIPTIDVPSGPAKELKINYSAIVKMKGGTLKEMLHDAMIVGPHVLLAADVDSFKVEASSDMGDVSSEYKRGSDSEINLDVNRTTSAIFSQEYLNDIILGCDNEEEIILNLGAPTPEDPRPKPLCVKYNIGAGEFCYYLAPRIESD